ncbi:MAG TPA: phosphatidylserine decarboxylase [Terriglobales bacterium]|nr:phosphatidylserine decarboxylase [Terriglobales bacterium]
MNIALLLGIAVSLFFVLPLAWKWQLGLRRVTIFMLLVGLGFSVALKLLNRPMQPLMAGGIVAVATVLVAAIYLAYRFYRDPDRTPTGEAGSIVSPADGLVIYVKRSQQGQVPVAVKAGKQFAVSELLKTTFYSSEVWVIGISMSLLDVHVNRAPIAGAVTFQKHFPGKFGSLRLVEREFDNERATTIFQNGNLQVAMVQIASRLVRQIVSYVGVGDSIGLGQRVGAIRLGSQVDLILPASDDIDITAQVGSQVRAGESILAMYKGK